MSLIKTETHQSGTVPPKAFRLNFLLNRGTANSTKHSWKKRHFAGFLLGISVKGQRFSEKNYHEEKLHIKRKRQVNVSMQPAQHMI